MEGSAKQQPPSPDGGGEFQDGGSAAAAAAAAAGAPQGVGAAAAQPSAEGAADSAAGAAGGVPPAGEPEPEVAALQGDVDELIAVARQRDEYLALAQRTQADFENYRKRVARESDASLSRGVTKVVKELLPALDNLQRALQEAGAVAVAPAETASGPAEPAVAVAAQPALDPFVTGVRLVCEEMAAALARLGIESFSPLGAAFDPAQHEAMAQVPSATAASGCIVEVYQQGYRLGDAIIRPARVLVAA